MTFKDLGTDDLGIYSCDVTNTDGIASSYLIDEEGKFKIRIPLKSNVALIVQLSLSDTCFSR